MSENKLDWTIHPGVHWAEAIAEGERTQRQIAAKMGISEKHLSQICRGASLPSAEVTVAFCRVLDLPVEMFWTLACNYRLGIALGRKDITQEVKTTGRMG
jgi:transcriptional regulator with XRE-family HTH domain